MKTPETYSFTRYLESKQSVDDRALNQRVWQTLKKILESHHAPVRLLEVGGGVGTMLTRFIQHQFFTEAEYTIIDQDPANTRRAFSYLKTWALKHNFDYRALTDTQILLAGKGQDIRVNIINAEMYAFMAQSSQKWDVVIAHAVLDLLDIQKAIPTLFQKIEPGGIFYFSINYDGLTAFEPVWDTELEKQILWLYHRSMDDRWIDGQLSGDSQSGRHLFSHLAKQGASILAAGSSDWIVFPQQKKYIEDEAYFLHHILSFFQNSLSNNPDLNQDKFHDWLKTRHRQIEAGELIYIAHQLDIFGKLP